MDKEKALLALQKWGAARPASTPPNKTPPAAAVSLGHNQCAALQQLFQRETVRTPIAVDPLAKPPL